MQLSILSYNAASKIVGKSSKWAIPYSLKDLLVSEGKSLALLGFDLERDPRNPLLYVKSAVSMISFLILYLK